MASTSMSSSLQQQAKDLERVIKTLTNDRLKEICRSQRLAVSGVKAALQGRILDHLSHIVQVGDVDSFMIMRAIVSPQSSVPRPSAAAANSLPTPAYSANMSPSSPVTFNGGIPYGRAPPMGASGSRPYSNNLRFRPSPFYQVLEPLMPPMILTPMTGGKSSSSSTIALSPHNSDRLRNEKDLCIMLYAAHDPALSPYSTFVDIAFPQHLEVKINGDEIKANYKGLKGKAGSTRPVDVTKAIRNLPNYKNTLQVTYAYTDKGLTANQKYHFVLNLVKRQSVEELAARVKKGAVFTKDQVVKEMQRKADDPDIVATSTVMSLKDPVSYTRIEIPVRSTVCTHNQCFDASSFLQLQEQAPTWTCPVCQKSVTFDALVLDLYVEDILRSTSRSTEQVTIEPDGKWTAGTVAESLLDDDEDSDDLVEISGPSQIKPEPNERMRNLLALPSQTPPLTSREESSVPTPSSAPRSSAGTKRTSEVIDLTLSDDDEPPRPAKRTAWSTPNGYPASSSSTPNGYRPANSSSSHHNLPSRPYPSTSFQIRPPQQPHSHGQSVLSSSLSRSTGSLSNPPSHDSYRYSR